MCLPTLFNAESLIRFFSLESWELSVDLLVLHLAVKVFVLRLFIRNHWPLYRRNTGRMMEWPSHV